MRVYPHIFMFFSVLRLPGGRMRSIFRASYGARIRAEADLRDHLTPGRRKDDAHREASALRRRHPCRGLGEIEESEESRDERLDGAREAARHQRDLFRAPIRI